MNTMFIKTPEDGFHFNSEGIAKIVEHYGAKYMGPWSILRQSVWTIDPVDVFYQPNPDVSKGHTHYFGMFRTLDSGVMVTGDRSSRIMITNAESAFSEPITGLLTEDGEVIVSRYRYDYVEKGPYMIDGGRDYLRTSGNNADGKLVKVTVVDGEFQFEVYDES